MASTNKTTNRGLNQWEATDKPVRGDFNADNLINDSWIKHGFFGRTGSQTISNNTETTIIFTTFEYGCGGTADLKYTDGGNVTGFIVPAGYTVASAKISVAFGANTTGRRIVYLYRLRDSTPLLISSASDMAQTSGSKLIGTAKDCPVEEDDVIYANVYQDSGGDLDIASNVTMSVTLF
jgi:hypothetical protein